MHEVVMCKEEAAVRQRGGAAVRLLAAAVLALGLAPAGAQNTREQAMEAAFADGMTTAVGVAASSGAINPVGGLLTIATKAVTFHHASTLPETEQPAAYAAASAMWMGSAVSNVCITAVFLSGGGFAPACLALGAGWGLKAWDDSEHERRFWERCAIVREFAIRQEVDCVYGPPSNVAAAMESASFEPEPQLPLAKQAGTKRSAFRQPTRKPLLARPEPAPVLVLMAGVAAPEPEPPPQLANSHQIEAP